MIIKIIKIPMYLIALIIVLLLRILSPILIIRLGLLDSGRIGGMVSGDWYLCEKKIKTTKKNVIDIFLLIQSTNHRNHFMISLWKRTKLNIIDFRKIDFIAKAILKINHLFPAADKYEIPMKNHTWPPQGITLKGIIACKEIKFISLTEQEQKKGDNILKSIGLSDNDRFICFHNRDSSFLNKIYPARNWSYHDYRDSHIENYIPAVEELIRLGYVAIRVGHTTSKKLPVNNRKIIDYPNTSYRSDFMDIYLLSKSSFSIFSETGLNAVDWIFRKPCLFVNWVLLKSVFYWQKGIFIPKKIYSQSKKRLLGFKEVIDQISSHGDGRIFKQNGWIPIENTPEEIASACIEMDKRINGKWVTNDDDKRLQDQYWELYGPDMIRNIEFCISAQFLRENIELLEM